MCDVNSEDLQAIKKLSCAGLISMNICPHRWILRAKTTDMGLKAETCFGKDTPNTEQHNTNKDYIILKPIVTSKSNQSQKQQPVLIPRFEQIM
jgi:hypothetical protein